MKTMALLTQTEGNNEFGYFLNELNAVYDPWATSQLPLPSEDAPGSSKSELEAKLGRSWRLKQRVARQVPSQEGRNRHFRISSDPELLETVVVLNRARSAIHQSAPLVETAQLSLLGNEDFSPSSQLLDFWWRGIEERNSEGQLKALLRGFSRVIASSTMRKEFTEQLYEALIDEFRSLRGPKPKAFGLFTEEDEFFSPIERRLEHLFPIRLRDGETFMALLTSELKEYFRRGNVLTGEWGTVSSVAGVIQIQLTAEEKQTWPKSPNRTVKLDL